MEHQTNEKTVQYLLARSVFVSVIFVAESYGRNKPFFINTEKYAGHINRFRVSMKEAFTPTFTEGYDMICLQSAGEEIGFAITAAGAITMPPDQGQQFSRVIAYPYSDHGELIKEDQERIQGMLRKYYDLNSDGPVIGEPDEVNNSRVANPSERISFQGEAPGPKKHSREQKPADKR